MMMILRLNTLVKLLDLVYSTPGEYTEDGLRSTVRKSSISYQFFVRGNDVFNCLPTDAHRSGKSLCYVSGHKIKSLTDARASYG